MTTWVSLSLSRYHQEHLRQQEMGDGSAGLMQPAEN